MSPFGDLSLRPGMIDARAALILDDTMMKISAC
jgi:hypothetical protein